MTKNDAPRDSESSRGLFAGFPDCFYEEIVEIMAEEAAEKQMLLQGCLRLEAERGLTADLSEDKV